MKQQAKAFSVDDALTFFAEAENTMQPDLLTQRKAFALLMPGIRALHDKHFSFKQVAEMLGKAGFTLKEATVRTYYNELNTKAKQNGNSSTKKTA